VTTGSFNQTTLGGGYPNRGSVHQRSWNGGDGKFEAYKGKQRDKWNNYTVSGRYQSEQKGSNSGFSIAVGGTGSHALLPWPNNAELKLQSKMAARIKGHQFNLAVNVAQGTQLVDMVVSNIRSLTRALVAVKRGDVASAARSLGVQRKRKTSSLKGKDISQRWLEMQYGWLPLVSDTYEAAKAYETYTNLRKEYITAKGFVGTQKDFSASSSWYAYPGTIRRDKRYVYEMTEDISAPRSLGLGDPLSLIWEILPYSFVIDWFLPIGSYLENLAVLPFLKGRLMAQEKCKYTAAYGGKYATAPVWLDLGGTSRSETSFFFSRTITLGFTHVQRPSFQSFPSAMSPRRIFNAVALSHLALTRTKKVSLLKAKSPPTWNPLDWERRSRALKDN
jgi:hypothetical protein